jgi:hypothetical protein
VSEAFGWRSGLEHKITRAPQFYVVIIAATLVGMVIAILEINPITALVLSAVINGLVAARLLVLVMLVSNSRAATGQRTNGRPLNVVGWVRPGQRTARSGHEIRIVRRPSTRSRPTTPCGATGRPGTARGLLGLERTTRAALRV